MTTISSKCAGSQWLFSHGPGRRHGHADLSDDVESIDIIHSAVSSCLAIAACAPSLVPAVRLTHSAERQALLVLGGCNSTRWVVDCVTGVVVLNSFVTITLIYASD